MECFTHSGAQAVGVCKSCGKAVCRACVVDIGVAIACCEKCAKEAADLHEMNQRGKKIYGIGVARKMPTGVLMWLMFGTIFMGSGIYQSYRNQEIEWFSLAFGVAAFFIAFIANRRAKDIGLQC